MRMIGLHTGGGANPVRRNSKHGGTMCKNKTLFAIAAIAVMLLSATNAYAYEEWWGIGTGTGTIYYNMYPYYYHHGDYSGTVHCETSGDDDIFDENTVSWRAVFYRYLNDIPDIAYILDSLVLEEGTGDYFDGYKDTGTSGIHYGSGTFDAVITNKNNYSVDGTWEASTPSQYYFTYNTTPPSMNGEWAISSILFNGGGTFNMERTSYSP